MKKKYSVKVYWECSTNVEVEAENEEEALDKAIEECPCTDGEYVMDSENADLIDVQEIS